MDRVETIQVIALLAGNYDSIAKKDKTQKELMINTWESCLGDLDYQLVLQAVKRTLMTSVYPPTIAEIRKNAIEIINPSTPKTAIEAWNEAYGMICNGIYMTQEEFDRHSPEVKKFFGNVRQVKEQAQVDTDIVNSVTKGQFLKQYEVIVEREKQQKLLPQSMQEYSNQLAQKMSIQQLGE